MSPARRDINTKYLPEFSKFFNKGQKVLFVGVNRQFSYKELFTIRGTNYETMDILPELKPDIVGDITKADKLQDKSYDGVILIGLWEYVFRRDKMLNEIYRILKPGGRALICVPGYAYYKEPGKHFDLAGDLYLFSGFFIDKICMTYYKTHDPYYVHIFARK